MLVGRDDEVTWLRSRVEEAIGGNGGVALLAGEAGVGKTRLVEEVAQSGDAAFVRGTPGPRSSAYGPIVAALRELGRTRPDGIRDCGPLKPHLALLLPELGEAVEASDRNTLFEAIRCGLGTAAGDRPAIVLIDDLHASDET